MSQPSFDMPQLARAMQALLKTFDDLDQLEADRVSVTKIAVVYEVESQHPHREPVSSSILAGELPGAAEMLLKMALSIDGVLQDHDSGCSGAECEDSEVVEDGWLNKDSGRDQDDACDPGDEGCDVEHENSDDWDFEPEDLEIDPENWEEPDVDDRGE